jgi:hypothetical protein
MRFSGVGHWLCLPRSERDLTPRSGIFPLWALAQAMYKSQDPTDALWPKPPQLKSWKMAVRLHENAWMPIPAPSRSQMRDSITHPWMDKARNNGLIRAKAPTLKLPSQRTRWTRQRSLITAMDGFRTYTSTNAACVQLLHLKL